MTEHNHAKAESVGCSACITPARKEYDLWVRRGRKVSDVHPASHVLQFGGYEVTYCCEVFDHNAIGKYQHKLVGPCAKGFK